MTTLPATYAEAAALEFARGWIAKQREPGGVFHPDSEITYGHVLMKAFALAHPFGADEIVYFAEHGSTQADLALRAIIAERTDRNEPLGAVLGAYNIRLLNPGRRRPGPARAANFLRDVGISELIAALVARFKLRPTRNTATRGPSASSVAAQALNGAGIISLSPKGIEHIWRRYLPAHWGIAFAPADYKGLFGPSSKFPA
jgi:hypothetical protein